MKIIYLCNVGRSMGGSFTKKPHVGCRRAVLAAAAVRHHAIILRCRPSSRYSNRRPRGNASIAHSCRVAFAISNLDAPLSPGPP